MKGNAVGVGAARRDGRARRPAHRLGRANGQGIINSDAALDLGTNSETASLQSCMGVPLLMGESLVGVLSLYAPAANAFADDCGRLIQMVAPHIAAAMHAASANDSARIAAEKAGAAPLRLVSSL